MATDSLFIRMLFGGGFATDYGPSTDQPPQQGGFFSLPWLATAENVTYTLDGGPRKVAGLDKLNSSALESGAAILGIFDWWKIGTGGSAVQHRIIHVGTKIKKDDGDGTFTDIGTGLAADALPSYTVMNDLLIMTSDGGDGPKSWDGTTFQALAGTPPTFSFCTTHKDRVWAAGVNANASRLYYTVGFDPEDWAGAGSGSIDIDPDDGDRITAIMSHKNDLWVFKGPYKGSIHRITGSSPTGDDAFARIPFQTGIGASCQRLVFKMGDDMGFVGFDGMVYALSVTASFGDYRKGSLTFPLTSWIREHVNFSTLAKGQAQDWPDEGQVWIALPIDASSTPNCVMVIDYRFEPVRISIVPAFDMISSLGSIVDPSENRRRILMAGCDDGFVRRLGRSSRSIDGTTAIESRVKTPKLTFGSPIVMKTLRGGSVGIHPRNAGDFTLSFSADQGASQSVTLTQSGGDTLAPTSGTEFTLDSSTLAGSTFVDIFFEGDYGEFRSIDFEVVSSDLSQDLDLHSISAVIEGGAWSFVNG